MSLFPGDLESGKTTYYLPKTTYYLPKTTYYLPKLNYVQTDPFTEQVGGDHYKTMGIQPVEYILANKLGFCEGNIVKYISRYKQKNGIQDVKKVIHYAQMLIAHLEKNNG